MRLAVFAEAKQESSILRRPEFSHPEVLAAYDFRGCGQEMEIHRVVVGGRGCSYVGIERSLDCWCVLDELAVVFMYPSDWRWYAYL